MGRHGAQDEYGHIRYRLTSMFVSSKNCTIAPIRLHVIKPGWVREGPVDLTEPLILPGYHGFAKRVNLSRLLQSDEL